MEEGRRNVIKRRKDLERKKLDRKEKKSGNEHTNQVWFKTLSATELLRQKIEMYNFDVIGRCHK